MWGYRVFEVENFGLRASDFGDGDFGAWGLARSILGLMTEGSLGASDLGF